MKAQSSKLNMVEYTLSFPEPHTHYAMVEMKIDNIFTDYVSVSLPVWTPGSYMIREFSRHIDRVVANSLDGHTLKVSKTKKNSWQVECENRSSIVLSYRVYCFEESVRTSFVDEDRAFINGANVFLSVDGNEEAEARLVIKTNQSWKRISTSLSKVGKNRWKRKINNYDELVDSPIEIGNHQIYEFEAAGIKHELAMVGPSNANVEKLVADLIKIIGCQTELMGSNPCDEYLFIMINTENNYGGLEHLFSSSNMVTRWNYSEKHYQKTISLLSHEYFHLWNVKRFRPDGIASFDYDNENYTTLLWFVEGGTSYYDDYMVYKAGVINQEQYLKTVASNLSGVVNKTGSTVQSLAEASFDAWIKYYRQNENSSNSLVSYYTRGAAIVQTLNFIILRESNCKYSFDDVMRSLYSEYLDFPEKGYTKEDIKSVLEQFAGRNLTRFFNDHIYGTKPVNFKKYFAFAGMEIINNNVKNNTPTVGWKLNYVNGQLLVKGLDSKYDTYHKGLNVNDEILAIDGFRCDENFDRLLENKSEGERVKLLIGRRGLIRNLDITLGKNLNVDYSIVPMEKVDKLQAKIRKKWLDVKSSIN